MLPSEPYLYNESYSVVSISNVLKFTQSYNHYYVIVKTGQADSSGSYFKIQDTKQCCHFLITKCKIFQLLIKPLFLRLFEPDQSEMKEVFYEIVNIHSVGDF